MTIVDTRCNGRRSGAFSLIELLVVVLILAVLASVAIPMYMATRQTAIARACRGNIAAISHAQALYHTRFGTYCVDSMGTMKGKGKGLTKKTTTSVMAYAAATAYVPAADSTSNPTGGLLGAPEGLANAITCPLDGSNYTCTANSDNPLALDIKCPNAALHRDTMGSADASAWQVTLAAGTTDTSN